MKIQANYIGIPGPKESFSWRAESNPKELFMKSFMGKILVKPWIYKDEKTFTFKAYKSIEALMKDWANITKIEEVPITDKATEIWAKTMVDEFNAQSPAEKEFFGRSK